MDGSLGYPSGYTPQGHPPGGWQGMSIKDILEKVDLFNFTSQSRRRLIKPDQCQVNSILLELFY